MPKSKVMKFPQKTRAVDEENALWFVAVAACFHDTYSCEYNYERHGWAIRVEASTFQGAETLVEQCRRALGWSRTEAGYGKVGGEA